MKLLQKTRTIAQALTDSLQVQVALVSCSVVGMVLAAGAGSQWN